MSRVEEALTAYKEAARLEPDNVGTMQAIEGVKAKMEGVGDSVIADAAMEQAVEDVKETPAERAKARGNKAFAANNFEDAIDHYSTAIEHDKGNHVLYSNRSAAYAGAGQMQSALNDAQKCINLKPMWAKGYMRKAVALMGLNRKTMAISAYQDGLKLDPANQSLVDGLAELTGMAKKTEVKTEEGVDVTDAGGEGGRTEGRDGKEIKEEVAVKNEEALPKAPSPPPMAEEELELLSSFLSETSDLERKQQVERICKYKLNPFEVLQLKPETATAEDMNMAYRKLSLMVHPDKCKHSRAEEAFEVCFKECSSLVSVCFKSLAELSPEP